jgi:iron complex outermembrane receptor protein
MDLKNYVAFGTYEQTLLNIRENTFRTYTISAPVNSKGRISGVELAWQQPIAGAFGVAANYTYADAEEKRSCPAPTPPLDTCIKDLVGASKNTYNLSAYYEDHGFGARVAYTYRSSVFVGLDRSSPQYQDDTGVLSASLSYTLNKNVSFNLDALNLNDPILKYYGLNESQPRAFYANGRQYYFGVRVKL